MYSNSMREYFKSLSMIVPASPMAFGAVRQDVRRKRTSGPAAPELRVELASEWSIR